MATVRSTQPLHPESYPSDLDSDDEGSVEYDWDFPQNDNFHDAAEGVFDPLDDDADLARRARSGMNIHSDDSVEPIPAPTPPTPPPKYSPTGVSAKPGPPPGYGASRASLPPPPTSPVTPLCIVCHVKPPYSRNGRAYSTCGLTCAAKLEASGPSLPPVAIRRRASNHGLSAGRSSPPPRPSSGMWSSYLPSPPPPQQQQVQRNTGRNSNTSVRRHLVGNHRSPFHTSTTSVQSDDVVVHQSPGGSRHRCVICKARSAHHGYVTCGFTCAEQLCKNGGDPTMCDYCHRRPRLPGQRQCGPPCAEKAKVACLLCKCRPRTGRYHLCGKTCKRISTKSTPLILEAHKGHATFDMVERKFKSGWKAGNMAACPEIKRVFKIIENDDFLRPYDLYRKQVGNESFRYHGTKRECGLGSTSTTLCTSTTCPVCNILRTSFKVSIAKTSGAFGAGVYSSSASNKAFSYSTSRGAMLLTKVVLGNIRSVTNWEEVKSCPPGFHSVVFDRQGGSLNETIVYSDDAIRPVFLITF